MTPATAGSGVEELMEPQRDFSPSTANARPGGIGEDGGGWFVYFRVDLLCIERLHVEVVVQGFAQVLLEVGPIVL